MRRAIGVFRKTARCLAGIVALAGIGLSLPGVVKAETFTGSLWLDVANASNATVLNAPSTTPDITFTTTAINFNDTTAQSNATVAQFFASNSAAVNVLTGSSLLGSLFTIKGDLVNGGYILFQGTTGLAAGSNSFSVSHDDGAELQVNGSTVFSAPLPTSEETSTGSLTVGTAGNYAFKLAYGEVNGTPAIVEFSPPPAVPEPSTLAIAGLGALGFGAYHYRRRRAGKA